jgi:hypothetical protein
MWRSTKWYRADARRSATRAGDPSHDGARHHVTEEALLRIINIARQHLDGLADSSAKDGFVAAHYFMYENSTGDRLTL